jgi:DNA mismatch endonuclease (patch repair protein)
MADVFTKAKRSEVMSAIRSTGNKSTEMKLAAILRKARITGWRSKYPAPGRPDFAFPRARVAVFVDGCFWHCCPKHGNLPKENRLFWQKKLSSNKKRDRLVNQTLRRAGWQVVRIWEHALSKKELPRRLAMISNKLKQCLLNKPHKLRIS